MEVLRYRGLLVENKNLFLRPDIASCHSFYYLSTYNAAKEIVPSNNSLLSFSAYIYFIKLMEKIFATSLTILYVRWCVWIVRLFFLPAFFWKFLIFDCWYCYSGPTIAISTILLLLLPYIELQMKTDFYIFCYSVKPPMYQPKNNNNYYITIILREKKNYLVLNFLAFLLSICYSNIIIFWDEHWRQRRP